MIAGLTLAMQGSTSGLQAFRWPVPSHSNVCEIRLDHEFKHIPISGVSYPLWGDEHSGWVA